jgi:putative transposase
VHKTANVLNALPKSVHGKAKQDLHAISEAANRAEAAAALDRFVAKYGPKYDKAAACLAKDREALLAFYAAPAEHWKHVRTTDVLDKHFCGFRCSFSSARATAWRRARPEVEASPRSPYRRSSVAASVRRAFGRSDQAATKR